MDSPKPIYPIISPKLGAFKMMHYRMPALPAHLISLKEQMNENSSFMTFRQKFTFLSALLDTVRRKIGSIEHYFNLCQYEAYQHKIKYLHFYIFISFCIDIDSAK